MTPLSPLISFDYSPLLSPDQSSEAGPTQKRQRIRFEPEEETRFEDDSDCKQERSPISDETDILSPLATESAIIEKLIKSVQISSEKITKLFTSKIAFIQSVDPFLKKNKAAFGQIIIKVDTYFEKYIEYSTTATTERAFFILNNYNEGIKIIESIPNKKFTKTPRLALEIIKIIFEELDMMYLDLEKAPEELIKRGFQQLVKNQLKADMMNCG